MGLFLINFFSNFRSHIKDSKWGRKYIFLIYTCSNGVFEKSHFSLQMGNCPIPVAEDSGHSGLLPIDVLKSKIHLFCCIRCRSVQCVAQFKKTTPHERNSKSAISIIFDLENLCILLTQKERCLYINRKRD